MELFYLFWGMPQLIDEQDIYPAEAMVGVVVSNLRHLARASQGDLQEIPSRLWLDVVMGVAIVMWVMDSHGGTPIAGWCTKKHIKKNGWYGGTPCQETSKNGWYWNIGPMTISRVVREDVQRLETKDWTHLKLTGFRLNMNPENTQWFTRNHMIIMVGWKGGKPSNLLQIKGYDGYVSFFVQGWFFLWWLFDVFL